VSTIESGLVTDFQHDLAAVFGQVYRTNGWNRMSVWNGYDAAATAAGIAQRTSVWSTSVRSTTAGNTTKHLTPGKHLARYRYVNSKTQYPSDPTDAVEINANDLRAAGSGSIYSLSNVKASADPKADRIIVELTDAGGATFFEATALANAARTSTALQTPDNLLRTRPLLYDEFGHDVPPFFAYVEAYRGRLWGLGQYVYETGNARISASGQTVLGSGTTWTSAAKGRFLLLSGDTRRFIESVVSATNLKLEESTSVKSKRNYQIVSEVPDVLRFSKALYVESFPSENAIRVLDGKPEKARALKGWRRDLVLFGERSMERFVYTEDPFADGSLEPVEGERGAASRRVVQDVGGALYALDYKGIHRFGGGSPEHLSESIDPFFDPGDRTKGYVDFAYRATFHSVHYPARHQILWFVVLNGDPNDSTTYTKPHHAVAFDYMNGTFSVYKFDVGIVASTVAPGSDGTTQTLLADENGRLWAFGIGTTDGVHVASAKSFTVKSGTTSNVVKVSAATLYAGGDGLEGATAYWVEGNLVRVIVSNAASSLKVSASYGATPAVGDTIKLGRIPSRWKSKAFFFEEPHFRRYDGRYLHLYFEPKASGTIRVRFYLDRSASAYDDYAEDMTDSVVTLDAANNYFEVDITHASGYARIPCPSTGSHAIEFEIEIVDAATAFEMTGFSLDDYAEESDGGP